MRTLKCNKKADFDYSMLIFVVFFLQQAVVILPPERVELSIRDLPVRINVSAMSDYNSEVQITKNLQQTK